MAVWDLPDGPVTIMFTDVEGSTALHTRLGDVEARSRLRRTEEAVRSAVQEHGGFEVKGTGDGHLLWFPSARRAVACAVAIQRALHDGEVRVRIGLSTGEVTAEDGDVYGEAVNLAARVAARAEGGEILVAEVVRQLTGTLGAAGSYREKGRYKLKGFPERVRLFAVDWARPDPRPTVASGRSELVGRDAEVVAVRSVLDRLDAGQGGVIVLEGEAGIGKSRLAAEAMVLAGRGSAAVLRGVAGPLDRTQPFRAIADALGSDTGGREAQPRLRALLDDAAAETTGHQVREACVQLVEERALSGPVVVVVEDLHWADPSTLQVLDALVPSTSDLPLVVLVTLRPSPRSAELTGLLLRFVDEGALHVRLSPLTDHDLVKVAAAAVGHAPDATLLGQLGKASGNPLYAIELARASEIGGETASSTLRNTILGRLAHLSSETLELLRLASVLGSTFTMADLATATGRSAMALLPVLDDALRAHVLVEADDRLGFRHDLIREAFYEDLPATVRKALHGEIGRALAAAGADAGVVAAHLAVGVAAGDLDAVEWISTAARQTSTRSLTAGIELLEQALVLCPPDHPRQAELEADLIVALGWSGQSDLAVERAQVALARHPQRAGELLLKRALAEVYLTTSRDASARQLALEVLSSGDLDPAGRAAFLVIAHFGQPTPEAGEAGREALALATAAGDEVVAGAARLVEAFPASFSGDWAALDEHLLAALASFDRANSPAAERYRLQALAWRAWLLDTLERRAEGALVRREARRRAEELGADAMVNTFDVDESMALINAGRLHDARLLLDEVVARQEAQGFGGPTARAWVGILSLWTGDPDSERLVERVRTLPDHWPVVEALRAHERGDHHRATDLLLEAFAENQARGHAWPTELASTRLLRSALACGRLDETEPVVLDAEARAAKPQPGATGVLMAQWCRALKDRDAALLRRAIGHPTAGDHPLEQALAIEDLGAILEERGDRTGAVTAFEQALALFDAMDLQPSIARVTGSLGRLGVAPRTGRGSRADEGWASLTPTERAVIARLVEGRSNPQIAEELFVSRQAVASHLRRVYAKLGLRSRVELAAAAAERDGRLGA